MAGYRSVGGNSDFYVLKYGVDCSCTSMPIATYTDTGTRTVGFTYTGPTSGIDSVRWDFGDGSTSAATNPTHTYTAPGTFHACVRIYSFCGDDMHCTDIVLPCIIAPTATFSTTGTTATRSFSYTGTTTALDSVVWAFGDGSHSTGLTATHTYTAIGTYTVCVTAYNPCGSSGAVCSTINVPCISAPVPSFTSSGATSAKSFVYTGTTTALDSVVWHFGDGTRGAGTTTSHTYSAIGTFTVCVIAYTPCGGDSSCSTVTIPCTAAPSASFTNTGSATVKYFTYSGTTVAIDSIGWNFGDGGHGTGSTKSHVYTATGTYTVCVTAYNPCGTNTACHTVIVPCITQPTASFTLTGTAPVNVTYTGTAIGLDSVAWDFGDGGHTTGLTATHAYTVPGTYTICVYAYNPCGWDSACSSVLIPCDTPIASFTHSGSGFAYTGTTVNIDSIVWSYGDGNRGTGNTSTHTYAASGIYHVCVTAYTNCTSDSACADIHYIGVGLNGPSIANIEVFPNPVTDDLTVNGISDATAYRLLNVAGVLLQNGSFSNGKNSISLKNYVAGVYILEITVLDGSKTTVRIVKE